MKPLVLVVVFILFVLTACEYVGAAESPSTADSTVIATDAYVTDTDSLMAARYARVSKQFTQSAILNPLFPKAQLLGTWTTSQENPSCDFLINERSFIYCDYDGNGERLYRIIKDSIYLDEAEGIRKGRILKANGDTLILRWDEYADVDLTFIRWKN